MDERDLEIANLKGQVRAYEEQLRSLSIEVLSYRLQSLEKANVKQEALVKKIAEGFGELKAEVRDRLNKASAAFVDLREQVKAIRTEEPTETGDAE